MKNYTSRCDRAKQQPPLVVFGIVVDLNTYYDSGKEKRVGILKSGYGRNMRPYKIKGQKTF